MPIANRVWETSVTPGVGNFTLAGAVNQYQTFNAAVGIGVPTTYWITTAVGDWETGIGQLSDATTFVRTTVSDNSLGTTAKINFTGVMDVFVSPNVAFFDSKADVAAISNINNTSDADKPISTATTAALALKATAANPVLTGAITEEVYALTGTVLEPDNGTIQTKTVAANTTFTDGLADGQSLTLLLTAGASYVITYPTMTWVTAAAPALTADDILVFFKVGTTLYGVYIGTTV